MSENNLNLDHPCKQTCSGWRQGYEKGMSELEQENEALRSALEFYADVNNWDNRCEISSFDDSEDNNKYGGKRAREVLTKFSKSVSKPDGN